MIHTILLAALLIAQAVSESREPSRQQADSQMKPAPGFTLGNLKGSKTRLSDFKGKIVLINLWATWCAPCLMEMPELVKWQKQYAARGLQIIGVTYPDESRNDVRRMAQKFKLNYPVLFGTTEWLEAYDIGEVLPVTVLVDRDGKIRDRILGILEPEEFKEKIEPLLKNQ